MYNTQMIEQLAAERRSELANEAHLAQLPKKARKRGSEFGVHKLRGIGGFLSSVGQSLKNGDRSNSAVSSANIDT